MENIKNHYPTRMGRFDDEVFLIACNDISDYLKNILRSYRHVDSGIGIFTMRIEGHDETRRGLALIQNLNNETSARKLKGLTC